MTRGMPAALKGDCVARTGVGSRLAPMRVALESHQQLWSSPDDSTNLEKARSTFSASPLKEGRPPQARVEERSKSAWRYQSRRNPGQKRTAEPPHHLWVTLLLLCLVCSFENYQE